MDGVWGNSEKCLKWDDGGSGGGVIEESLLKQLKSGMDKGRNCSWGGDLEGTPPVP